MMKALLAVRFRAMLAGLTAQGRRKKKQGKGMLVLFAVLYLYVAVVICGAMGMTFFTLAEPYHKMGLDWLYFSMAGLMAVCLSVFGSVFATQNQLYDAKDNEMLLSMPIPPRNILLSRMVPLLLLNLLFGAIVFIPAAVVYAVVIEASAVGILLQLVALFCVTALAQTIACLLGWLLHLLLSKVNKSVASMVYMVLFLGVYFIVYSQAEQILNAMALQGTSIAGTLQTWVWPIYALGQGCLGNPLFMLGVAAITAVVFGVMYAVLSLTFLRTATMRRSGRKRGKLNLSKTRVSSPANAILYKEFKKFIGCPVYLTNMGLGVILTAAIPVVGLIFRNMLLSEFRELLPFLQPLMPLLICAILAFTASTCCISTPSVSLEGKNIWLLKSLPVSIRGILEAKLRFHCLLTAPVMAIATLILTVAYGCSPVDCVLSVLTTVLLVVLNGVLGMVAGLQWARLDYISESYPCKQSVAVLVTMFSMMGVPLVLGLIYGFLLLDFISPTVFLAICAVLLAAASFGLYRLMVTWGVQKWESLS